MSIPDLILGRAARPNYAYKLAGNRLAIADSAARIVPSGVDTKKMTVKAVISSIERDRAGDEVVSTGCDLTHYQDNPTVTYSHQLLPLPIGRAMDPDGNLTVEIEEKRILATTWFAQSYPEALQVFALIAEGMLKGVSVGFEPLSEPERLGDKDGHLYAGFRFPHWSLLEFSFCIVPMSAQSVVLRDAEQATKLRGVLSAGKVAGVKLSGIIRKSLEPFAEAKPTWSQGWTPPQKESESPRWNRSLTKAFDVALQPSRAANVEYDWISRHIGCKVKEIFQTGNLIPTARMGSFLTGLKQALIDCTLNDVRNLTYDGRETPPVNEVIQLNSKQRDTFLIDGLAFYTHPIHKFAIRFSPFWGGVQVTGFADQKCAECIRSTFDSAREWAATNNFLKGEAFSLSGEFLERTSESWGDVFLEDRNKKAMQRILKLFNGKGKNFANRGAILTGPPGTGKTLSGRIIRNEAKGTFLWVSSRDFHMSGSFGGIAYAFDMAKELAPCVLFVEDVDNWLSERSIDLLKTEMDGISRSSGVLTILTTNFPERLPEALIDRPGRFHEILHFAVPTARARAEMLRKWLPGYPESEIAAAIKRTDGYSGAHVYELANFAKVLQEQDGLEKSEALREALRKIAEQKDLITQIQLRGSHYRPTKAVQTPARGPVTKDHIPDQLSKLFGGKAMAKRRKAEMTETDGTAGGYAEGEKPEAKEEGEAEGHEQLDAMKDAITGVMDEHKGDAPSDGPHDAYLHGDSKAICHVHSAMAHPDHLKACKDDLEGVEGHGGVTQSTEAPEGEGHEKVYAMKADEPPAEGESEGDETNPDGMKSRRGKAWDTDEVQDGSDVNDDESRTKEEEEEPEEKAETEAETEPEPSPEATAADTLPPAAACAQHLIEYLEGALGNQEPETREFFDGLLSQVRDFASERYPDMDTGGAEPEAEATDGEAKEDGDEATERYRHEPKHHRAALVAVRKSMEHNALTIIREAADTMHGHAQVGEGEWTAKHKKMAHAHGRALDGLYGAMAHGMSQKAEEEKPEDEETPEETPEEPERRETSAEETEQPEREEGEKALDMDRILAELVPLKKTVESNQKRIKALNGRR